MPKPLVNAITVCTYHSTLFAQVVILLQKYVVLRFCFIRTLILVLHNVVSVECMYEFYKYSYVNCFERIISIYGYQHNIHIQQVDASILDTSSSLLSRCNTYAPIFFQPPTR